MYKKNEKLIIISYCVPIYKNATKLLYRLLIKYIKKGYNFFKRIFKNFLLKKKLFTSNNELKYWSLIFLHFMICFDTFSWYFYFSYEMFKCTMNITI